MSLTRIVQTMSAMHSSSAFVRSGLSTDVVGAIVFAPKHFPKFLAGCMMTSGLTGYFSMEYIQQRQWERRDRIYDEAWEHHREQKKPSENKAVLSAMIENAKQSSLRENAMEAHEHFMLGSRGRQGTELMRRITERVTELKRGQNHVWATGE